MAVLLVNEGFMLPRYLLQLYWETGSVKLHHLLKKSWHPWIAQKHQRLTFKPDDRADIVGDMWTTVTIWATNTGDKNQIPSQSWGGASRYPWWKYQRYWLRLLYNFSLIFVLGRNKELLSRIKLVKSASCSEESLCLFQSVIIGLKC